MKKLNIPQYEIKWYSEADNPKIQELFARCFGGRTISNEAIEWQLMRNPVLKKRAVALWDQDALIAYTSLTPSYCTLNGQVLRCACSGTTMAHDEYLGVSVQLFKECERLNSDIEVIYGFPNKNSFPITKYVGHHYVGDMAFWHRKPQCDSDDSHIGEIFAFGEKHGELYKPLTKNHSFIKNRNTDYLNWRFVDRPGFNYRIYEYAVSSDILGYMVVSVYQTEDELHYQIIDLIAENKDVFKSMMRFAIHKSYLMQADVVKLWMPSKEYAGTLEELGFAYGLQPFKCSIWNNQIVLEDSYLTMSDSDIF